MTADQSPALLHPRPQCLRTLISPITVVHWWCFWPLEESQAAGPDHQPTPAKLDLFYIFWHRR